MAIVFKKMTVNRRDVSIRLVDEDNAQAWILCKPEDLMPNEDAA